MWNRIIEIINGLRNYNNAPDRQRPDLIAPVGGGKPRASFIMPTNASAWKGVVIHHSENKDNPGMNDWESIRHYHKSWRIDGTIVTEDTWRERKARGDGKKFEKPWRDIGYHLGVERDSNQLIVRIGRSWTTTGAHAGLPSTNEYNEEFLGLCVVGNYDKAAPDQEMWDLVLSVVRALMDRFSIQTENVIGHREVYDRAGVPREKECPGSFFDMGKFRKEL